MMESLRNFLTGPRLFIVIAACALPFVFLGTSSLGTVFGGSLGTINGEDVSEADLNVAQNITIQRFKNIYGEEFDFNLLDEEMQFDQIKQELIVQKVLLSEARSLGFVNENTRREAKKDIIKNPLFQLDGVFDENIYEAQVNSNGQTKDGYIDLMTDLKAIELYRASLASLNFSTNKEALDIAYLLEQTVDVDFIKIDSDALKRNIINTDEELEEFYNLNQVLFYSEEKRSFKYLTLNPQNYAEKVIVPEGYIESAYSEYLSKADERTQIRFSHIMIDKANYDSSAEAFNAIQEVELKLSSGEDFSDLASIYSDDIVSKGTGGDLEYFASDIFPSEFADAIKNLNLNDISPIIELDDTLHILKITEFNEAETLSMEVMKKDIIDDLIDTESLALMNDDAGILDEMISSSNSLDSIADAVEQNVSDSEMYSVNNFNFYEQDPRIKEFVFNPNSEIGVPTILELDDSIIIIALNEIKESTLNNFENIINEVSEMLSKSKAVEKQNLLISEIEVAKSNDSLDSFISAYNFISKDSFIEVNRYSSLMPQEILAEVFKQKTGNSISLSARNGDSYILDLVNMNSPAEESIEALLEQYKSFSEERLSSKMSEIINDDVFNNARVNLSNLVF
jgi:parvulin-like peptidyl-prolyl isomerase